MTATPTAESATDLVRLARHWAAEQPDAPIYVYLEDGRTESDRLTYGELDRRARAFAAQLQARGLSGQRAMLVFPPGIDFAVAFVGCLYAGVAPVPAYPPEPHRLQHTLRRLISIIEDAQAPVVVTSPTFLAMAQALVAQAGAEALKQLDWLTLEEAADPDAWTMPDLDGSSLAFLQYTSGSTSAPKGVAIRHGGLITNMRMAAAAYRFRPREEINVSWLPVYHDMGLVGILLNTLITGSQAHLMPPYAFLKRPLSWLELLSSARATCSAAPNFAFDLCVRKVTPEQRDRLDLSHLRNLANGAEPVRAETVDRFLRFFEPAGLRPDALRPSYGMAEVGLFISTGTSGQATSDRAVSRARLARHAAVDAPPGDPDALRIVSCGPAGPGSDVRIVHPTTRRALPAGAVGEIWIAGPHVAAGYWQRPEETEHTFGGRLADTDEGPFLRTGDLGFLAADGDLFVTGRRKDLLIIRGRNLYPQDIERTLDDAREALPELRPGCAAAVSTEIDGEEQLIVLQEIDPDRAPDHDPARVVSTLRDVIARDHQVQPHTVVLLARGTLPKTSSGKVMRQACKKAFLADFEEGGLKVVHRDSLAADDGETPRPLDADALHASAAAAEGLLAWLRDGLAEHLDPSQLDRGGLPNRVMLALGRHGLLGLQVPRDSGGLGLGAADAVRIMRQLGAIDGSVAAFVVAHNALGAGPILHAATAERRAALLPELTRGRALAAFALIEPDAGDRLDALTTTVEADDAGGLRLRGEKLGVASTAEAEHLIVVAREGDSTSAFVIDRGAGGWQDARAAAQLGLRGLSRGGVRLEDAALGEHDRLGPAGGGAAVVEAALDHARVLAAATAVGATARCLQVMARFAGRRRIDGGWLLDHPVTLARMTAIADDVAGIERLLGVIAMQQDAGATLPPPVAWAAKNLAAEAAWRAADHLVQCLGGRGGEEANGAARLLRDARAGRLVHGSTESLRDRLGRALIEDDDALMTWVDEALGAPTVAGRLREAAATLRAALEGGHRPPPAALRLQALYDAGRFVERALGLAALEAAAGADRSAAAARDAWAAHLDAIPVGLPASPPATARSLAARVGALTAAIGDLDVPGRDVDPLLQTTRRPAAGPAPSGPRPARPAPAPRTRATPQEDPVGALRTWMVGWIAREVGTTPTALLGRVGPQASGRTPFTALGIDSVTTVQFVAALEEKLGCAIPTTALLEHDDVDALARHLVGRSSV